MAIAAVSKQSKISDLLPIPFWQSVGFFGLPWLFFVVSIYFLLPALYNAGVPIFLNFLISLGIPLGLLIVASWIAYQREGQPWSWNEYRNRFRLGSLQTSTWL